MIAPTRSSWPEAVGAARTKATTRSAKCSGVCSSRRPRRSFTCSTAMTVAMPAVKPVVTGCGMNSMSFPIRRRPIPMSRTPAMRPATSRPEWPKRA
ncbi:MAG: hypothetical protein QM704_13050 [Anaeromyxobacteraceae bacterium]